MSANGMRANQNNVQIDGITSMDTGSNQGPSVSLAIDAVQEIKVLTSNYQAEYGRSAGAQITAVTKSGGRDFHGSGYSLRRNDDLNANTWFNNRADAAPAGARSWSSATLGYSIGGPVILPGGFNKSRSKLFFFVNQEFQERIIAQTHAALTSGCPPSSSGRATSRRRATARATLFPVHPRLHDRPALQRHRHARVLPGRRRARTDPANRLYQVGLNILKMYPDANSRQHDRPGLQLRHAGSAGGPAPAGPDPPRLDAASPILARLRQAAAEHGHQRSRRTAAAPPASRPTSRSSAHDDAQRDNRGISMTAAVTLNNTTFLEMTYGRARNAFTNIPRYPDEFNKTTLGLSALPDAVSGRPSSSTCRRASTTAGASARSRRPTRPSTRRSSTRTRRRTSPAASRRTGASTRRRRASTSPTASSRRAAARRPTATSASRTTRRTRSTAGLPLRQRRARHLPDVHAGRAVGSRASTSTTTSSGTRRTTGRRTTG